MKKAIFLVEDIKDGQIITLLEKKYEKLIEKLHEEHLPFQWISEVGRVLSGYPTDIIQFQKASDFVNDVKNGKPLPLDKDIYYFISAWLHVSSFSLTDFFSMDPVVTDFLVEYRIPVIIDGSMESDNIIDASYNLFEQTKGHGFIEKREFFRDIHKLKFYIVGGSATTIHGPQSSRIVDVKHVFFPTAFFHIAYYGSPIYVKAEELKDEMFQAITEKTITSQTPVWHAFCRTPRLTRILFQLWAQKEGLIAHGKFSRLIPCRDTFLKECKDTGIFKKYPNRLNFLDEKILNELDKLYHIDKTINQNCSLVGVPFDNNSMFQIVLETCMINCGHSFNRTPMMLTEKTSMTILSGVPFITLGGYGLKKILTSSGFQEYRELELPDSCHQNFFDELDYVIEKVKFISGLPLNEKQKLYDSWKEIIIHNYNWYLSLNPQKIYLEFLAQAV